VLGANSQVETSEKRPCGRTWLESGDQDCVSASTRGMRCKGARAMWQGERMWWKRGVVVQWVHKNSRDDMECEWRIDVERSEREK
jgi:hypothetical protein